MRSIDIQREKMFSQNYGTLFVNFKDILSLSQLLLKWPFRAIHNLNYYTDERLQPYILGNMYINDKNENLIKIVPHRFEWSKFKENIKTYSQFVFLKTQIVDIERQYPDSTLIPCHAISDPQLICTESSLRMFAIRAICALTAHDKSFHDNIEIDLLDMAYSIEDINFNQDIFKDTGVESIELYPAIITIQPQVKISKNKIDLKQVTDIIENMRLLGQTNVSIIAKAIKSLFPALTPRMIGSLLPAHAGTAITPAGERQRGRRLLGQV